MMSRFWNAIRAVFGWLASKACPHCEGINFAERDRRDYCDLCGRSAASQSMNVGSVHTLGTKSELGDVRRTEIPNSSYKTAVCKTAVWKYVGNGNWQVMQLDECISLSSFTMFELEPDEMIDDRDDCPIDQFDGVKTKDGKP
jgi:hypothetical protein